MRHDMWGTTYCYCAPCPRLRGWPDQSDPPGRGCSTLAGQQRPLSGLWNAWSSLRCPICVCICPFLAHAHTHTNTHTPLPHNTQATTGTDHAATRCTQYAPAHLQRVQKQSVHGTSPEAHGGGIWLLLQSPCTLVVQTCMVLTRHVACSGIMM
ncbi:hypothetical protein B0I37DRAFT_1790 [Chaetomium sp. MPI-CAGE-AT-0009]|nr:hypothetical protein B0I37DRAFT_1790 [Chaetomium sp. MPI-CAGE-AT-0009]